MESPSLTYINKLTNGDNVFLKKLITVIKAEFPLEKELYYKNISSNNLEGASQNVHKLKHKISILSFDKGYAIAAAHENNLREHNNSLNEDFNIVLEKITYYLTKI